MITGLVRIAGGGAAHLPPQITVKGVDAEREGILPAQLHGEAFLGLADDDIGARHFGRADRPAVLLAAVPLTRIGVAIGLHELVRIFDLGDGHPEILGYFLKPPRGQVRQMGLHQPLGQPVRGAWLHHPELQEQTLFHVARADADGLEALDASQDRLDLFYLGVQLLGHLHRGGFHVPVVVDVADEPFTDGVVAGGEPLRLQRHQQVLLQRHRRRHAGEGIELLVVRRPVRQRLPAFVTRPVGVRRGGHLVQFQSRVLGKLLLNAGQQLMEGQDQERIHHHQLGHHALVQLRVDAE